MTWEKWSSKLKHFCNWQNLILVSLLVFIFLQNLHALDSINQDIGRHLKTGEIIWQTHSVPRTNLFSYTEPDQPFINHHWLSELIFYWLYSWFGFSGLIIFKAVVITTAFALLLKSLPTVRPWLILVLTLLGWVIFFDRADVRPEIFSYLYLALFWWLIWRVRQGLNHRWLLLLIPVQILWINSHIYFALGPLLLLALALENKKYYKYLLLVSLATLINPNFIQGALIPLTIFRQYGYSVVENQSIFFLIDYGILGRTIALFQFSLIILIISFVLSWRKRHFFWYESMVALVFSLLAIRMIRNFAPYILVFIPIVITNCAAAWPSIKTTAKRWGIILTMSAIIMLIILTIRGRALPQLGLNKELGLASAAGAAQGVEFIKQNHIAGPVFNNFDVGSYLIWQLYPDQKVFVDGRPEAYSVDFFDKIYKPMQTDPVAWEKYVKQYSINYVFFDWHDITPWAQTFLARISRDPNWPLVYKDGSVVIFLKRSLN